jgi:hypothetical protein
LVWEIHIADINKKIEMIRFFIEVKISCGVKDKKSIEINLK